MMGLSKFQGEAPPVKENSVWGILTQQLEQAGYEKIGNLEIRGRREFREEVKGAMERGMKTPECREGLREVAQSERNHLIVETTVKNSEVNAYPNDEDHRLKAKNGVGTKTITEINLDDVNNSAWDDNNCKKTLLEAVVCHEVAGHVPEYDKGKAVDGTDFRNYYDPKAHDYKGIPPSEKGAVAVENAVRRDNNMTPRSHYFRNLDPNEKADPNCELPSKISPPPTTNQNMAPSPYPRMGL